MIDIWNLERIELITTLRITAGLPQGMLALFFGSDGRLRTIGRDNPMPVLTWDIDAPRVVSVGLLETAHAAFFERAAITSDELVLVATGPRETTVWHLDSSKRLATVPHGANGQALAVSLDGTIAATAGHEIPGSHATFVESEALRLWSLPDLREIRCWKLRDFGCRDIACALAFGPDGKCLVVAGWEGVLRRVVLPAS